MKEAVTKLWQPLFLSEFYNRMNWILHFWFIKNILFLLPHREIIIERIKDIIDPAVAVFVGFW